MRIYNDEQTWFDYLKIPTSDVTRSILWRTHWLTTHSELRSRTHRITEARCIIRGPDCYLHISKSSAKIVVDRQEGARVTRDLGGPRSTIPMSWTRRKAPSIYHMR